MRLQDRPPLADRPCRLRVVVAEAETAPLSIARWQLGGKGQIGLSGMVWEAQNAGSDRGATVRLPGNRKNCYLLQR